MKLKVVSMEVEPEPHPSVEVSKEPLMTFKQPLPKGEGIRRVVSGKPRWVLQILCGNKNQTSVLQIVSKAKKLRYCEEEAKDEANSLSKVLVGFLVSNSFKPIRCFTMSLLHRSSSQ
jgi:hypothetical protein